MKKTLVAFGIALLVVLCTAVPAVAASTTAADVQALALAESEVITLLHEYTDTAPWTVAFKTAIANEDADLAKVNCDLALPATTNISWTLEFYIPSHSMEPTLTPGESVVVNQTAYRSEPVPTGT